MSPWPRIALLMQRYSPAARSHWPDIVRLLREWGATADPVCLADTVIDVARLRADYDLHVLQDESDLALRVGAALHGAGAALLNPYPVSAMLRDKIVTCRVLQAVGVPVPETFLASQVQQLEPALERGPLVVKPYRGSRGRGRGIRVVRDAAELAALGRVGAPLFAQRYHAPEGLDRRIYSIGSELLGVLRLRRARTPFTLSPE